LLLKFFSKIKFGPAKPKPFGFLAGDLLREEKIPFLRDALIATTCLIHEIQLATRNKKHFQNIPKLEFYDLK